MAYLQLESKWSTLKMNVGLEVRIVFISMCVLLCIALMYVSHIRISDFHNRVMVPLEQVTSTENLETAKKNLEIAVHNCEKHGYTSGCPSILRDAPENDVGVWYNKLKDELVMLRSVKVDDSQNVHDALVRVKKNLDSKSGFLKIPSLIAFSPHQDFHIYIWFLVLGSTLVSIELFIKEVDKQWAMSSED